MYFDNMLKVRVGSELLQKIEDLLDKEPDKYSNVSHVVRCAIINLHDKLINGKNKD